MQGRIVTDEGRNIRYFEGANCYSARNVTYDHHPHPVGIFPFWVPLQRQFDNYDRACHAHYEDGCKAINSPDPSEVWKCDDREGMLPPPDIRNGVKKRSIR